MSSICLCREIDNGTMLRISCFGIFFPLCGSNLLQGFFLCFFVYLLSVVTGLVYRPCYGFWFSPFFCLLLRVLIVVFLSSFVAGVWFLYLLRALILAVLLSFVTGFDSRLPFVYCYGVLLIVFVFTFVIGLWFSSFWCLLFRVLFLVLLMSSEPLLVMKKHSSPNRKLADFTEHAIVGTVTQGYTWIKHYKRPPHGDSCELFLLSRFLLHIIA